MNNRVGIPVLDAPARDARDARDEQRQPVAPPAQVLLKRAEAPIVCATPGCRLPGVYLRADGPCCPDCLPALLVAEHRAETRGKKYLYDEAAA